jgi:CAAX prenyl protease-like protein
MRKIVAFTLPMAIFISLLGLVEAIRRPGATLWFSAPEHWIYPAQTVLCAAAILWFWRDYEFRVPRKAWFAILIGIFVWLVWIAPQQFLGFEPRTIGFNPEAFGKGSGPYGAIIFVRFLRLVVVVPLLEEIFWRGFLLRYLIREHFTDAAVGTFSWLSFFLVTVAFGFTHSRADWIPAMICGALYNLVAYRTRSLTSCVVAHAVTNLLLGVWIMQTRQWGFW